MNGTWLTLGATALLAGAATLRMGRAGSRYRTPDEAYWVTSLSGKRYHLRVIRPGDVYGSGVKNKTNQALLEFWWEGRDGAPDTFTGERYYLTTLVKGGPKGLSLQGDREGFSAETMNRAIVWALGGNPDSPWG